MREPESRNPTPGPTPENAKENAKESAPPQPSSGRLDAPLASLRSDIDSFIVMDVMTAAAAREAAGARVIHMEVGQPATPAPRAARRALAERLERDSLGYTLALGIEPLRERIAEHYFESYGIRVAPSRVVVTTGSSAGFILAFLACFDQGARVALPSPGYPCYRQILKALGQQPVLIETGPYDRWMPTPESLREVHARSPLAGALIASPANPTGTMLEPDRLAAICATCRDNGHWFISDEIYHGLTYGETPPATALAYSDDAIIINSFSKYFSMTGWRVGWMIVPERLVRVVERLTQNLYISAPAASQIAALGAFDGREELEANVRVYARNRQLLLDRLPQVGFDRIVPADGAFYLYCDVSSLTGSSVDLAAEMLREIDVAATPGVDFDAARGHCFLRFSYARSTADMTEALDRMAAWPRLRQRRGGG